MSIRVFLFFTVLLFLSFYGAVLMAAPSADRIFRLVVFACDGIMIVMALSVIWRNRSFPVVRYLVLFLFVSTLTLFLNLHSVAVATHLNGLRQPLFLLSTLIVLYDISQSARWDQLEQLFTKFLILFALLQIPLSIIQFAKFGAGDMVGGTYGYTGGSGYVTQLMFLTAFYFIARSSWTHDIESVRFRSVLLYSVFLLPCALNETKASFVYLAVLIVLLTMTRKKILKAIPLLTLGVMLILLLNYYYGKNVGDTAEVFDERFLERYLVYDPRENVDVPRFQKLVLMFQVMHGDIGSVLFGLGYGVFAGENILGTSAFGRSLWYFQGTRMLLQAVWIQGGLLAAIILLLGTFWFIKRRALLRSANMRRFRTFLAFVLTTVWFYNEALYSRPFVMIAGFMMTWVGVGGMDRITAQGTPDSESVPVASEAR
ncbi:hypothetical protein EHM92_02625 [bacterium]|nr:MAG: hypothetical protein EHM92_02625 [bacterium]